MISISHEQNLKKVCVAKRGDKYYFPKTIPRERESMTFTHMAFMVLFLGVHIYLSHDVSKLPSLYAVIIIFYFLVCLLYRCILFYHELAHSCRYENNIVRISKAAFYVTLKTSTLIVLCILYLVYYVTRHGLPSLQDKYWLVTIPVLFFLHRLLNLDNCRINDSLCIAKEGGLDYGSGMAYSFFYGYLNYMLAKIGEPNKNLKEMMEDYESLNGIKFAVYKIFILIPKSLECFESIHNVSKLMEMRSTLPQKTITVAGVRDRVYKNSVYTIKHPSIADTNVYVCTEYATPLKTFKEVVKHSTAHTVFYNRHKNDILLQFYLTLKQILEHNNMHNMCELVYYEDMDEKNNFHDVGRILLNKIAEIKKTEAPKEK